MYLGVGSRQKQAHAHDDSHAQSLLKFINKATDLSIRDVKSSLDRLTTEINYLRRLYPNGILGLMIINS